MKIIDKIFKIENASFSLEFFENFFKERALIPVRWAIVDVSENTYMLNAAIIED